MLDPVGEPLGLVGQLVDGVVDVGRGLLVPRPLRRVADRGVEHRVVVDERLLDRSAEQRQRAGGVDGVVEGRAPVGAGPVGEVVGRLVLAEAGEQRRASGGRGSGARRRRRRADGWPCGQSASWTSSPDPVDEVRRAARRSGRGRSAKRPRPPVSERRSMA